MNRRQLLGYGVSASLGAAAGLYIPKMFKGRGRVKDNPLDDFRSFFRVKIYSEEWVRGKEGQNAVELMKFFYRGELSSVNFCFNSSYFQTADLYKEEDILAKDVVSEAGFVYVSLREVGKVNYTFIFHNKKEEKEIILPVRFKDNMDLMTSVTKAEVNGEDEETSLEDFSKGYPRRALIDRKEEVDYEINGLEAIAETSQENLREYFQRIRDFKSYDDFLLMKRREETIEGVKPQSSSNLQKS